MYSSQRPDQLGPLISDDSWEKPAAQLEAVGAKPVWR